MKIKTLDLQNVLSHQSTKLDLAALTVIRGDNGSGKSTIVNAINALITGRASCTNEKGSGIEQLIRDGEDKAVITAEIEDGDLRTLRGSITEKSGRNVTCKKESDAGYTGSDYLAILSMKRDILRCLIDGSWFFNPLRSDADQKELLASIILPDTVEFEPWVWPLMAECGLTVKRDQKPFELIQAAYDAAFEERKIINRSLKDWREPEAVPAQEMSVEQIRARLNERQQQRTAAAVKRDKLLSDFNRSQETRSKAAGRIQALELKMAQEQSRRSDIAKGILSPSALKEHRKIAGNAEKAADLDAQIGAVNADITANRRAKDRFFEAWDKGKCPTCTRELPEDIGGVIDDQFVARANDLAEKERGLQDERKTLGDPAGAKANIDAHVQAEKNVALIDQHIGEIEKDIAELRKALEGDGAAQPDTSAVDAEIKDLDTRIERGNAALIEATRAEGAIAARQKKLDEKAALDAKHGKLERLLEYFGPKGVSTKLLDSSVAPFERAMNAVLAGWGFQCRLQFAPFAFSVSFAGRDRFFPLRTLAVSQKAMFQVAFQVALAKTTGFNFVVVDAADIWLDAKRAQLYKNLLGAGLDQVIVLQSDLRREIPPVEDAAFYLLTLDAATVVTSTLRL